MKIITCKYAVSPAMGIILMLAVTVFLSALVHSAADVPQLRTPLFTVLESSDKIVPHRTGLYRDSQIVKITSLGGDDIPVSNLEVEVSVYRNDRLLVSETCRGFPVKKLGDAECSGDDLLDKGYLGYDVLGELHADGDGILTAGEFVGFRIKSSSGGIQLKPGDRISVVVVDMNSGLVVARIDRTVR